MNIFRYASSIKPAIAVFFDKALETVAHVLCVQSHGVMVCGAHGGSVAHFSNPHFSKPLSSGHENSL